jgi:beta-lactamase regulating signal transducer with metallopeptidase domain
MSEFLGTIDPWALWWGENMWRASLQGGLAIAAAWVLGRWCRFLSARVTCWIWRLACLKLLFALFLAQPVDLPLLAARPTETVFVHAAPTGPPVSVAVVHESRAGVAPEIVRRVDLPQAGISLATLLCLLWVAGVCCGMIRTARQWRAIVRLRHEAQPARSVVLLRELREEAARLEIGRLPQLHLSPQAENVQLVGIWRPAIMLPESAEEAFDADERRLILAHELGHLKRRDLAWNWLPTVAGWLFFFHPLVWVMVRRWCEAQEAACDEFVLRYHGARRAQYGRLLLKMSIRWPDGPRSTLIAAGMSGAYRSLERRLLAMTHAKPQSTRRLAVAAAAVFVIAVGGLIPWRLVAQEPARTRPPAPTSAATGEAPGVPAAQLPTALAQNSSSTSSTSSDGTSGTSSTSSTGIPDHLPGKIYVRAGLQVKTKTGGTEKVTGIISIDPNTGAWERLGLDGFFVRVSPQQDRLAFCRFVQSAGRQHQTIDIYLADSQGRNSSKVVDDATLSIWSPDGKRLVYSQHSMPKDTNRRHATWIVDLLDKRPKALPIPATDEVDDWSRDGEWFVTVSNRHPPFGSGYQLYVMHPDGTHERRITKDDGLNCYPRFRPGTNQIVYNHQSHGFDSLWLIDLDGTNRKQLLTSDQEGAGAPDGAYWSPDGKWLAVLRFDWQTDIPGVLNRKKERMKVPGYCKDQIEIIAPDGSSRGVLKLAGVTHVDWIEHGDWR